VISRESPFYLKKVRESKPKLYDGNVILKMDAIVIPDSDETLMLCEESLDTPMVEKSKLDEDKEGKTVDPSHYRSMIDTLLYLAASRPDL
ncbi:hypothetical protein Tco_1085134, partial [Tanacetum coccineum]